MSLAERLTEDLKLAMKARDQLRMDVIRMAKAALLNKEIELKKDLDESEMNRVLITLVKQRKEAGRLRGWERGHAGTHLVGQLMGRTAHGDARRSRLPDHEIDGTGSSAKYQ